jgi:tRNA A-37 threonylcarbamoyl transferase component Bud32
VTVHRTNPPSRSGCFRGDPGVLARFVGPGGLRLAEWLADGSAVVVKDGPHRTVYRVRRDGFDVHIKHCRLIGVRGWLRQALRPAKARLEFERAREVAARGVATVEPLAWGSVHPWLPADSFLITRSLPDAVPLGQYLEAGRADTPRLRQAIAREVGRFLARTHDAGLTHPDLHPGNLLVELSDGKPTFRLIDLHAIALTGPVSADRALANLSMLNRWFVLRASRTDRLRCWRAYRAARPGRFADSDARRLEAMTWTSNLAFWRGRDARCTGNNRYFRKVRSNAALGHAARNLDPALLARLLADPDAPFRVPGVRLLKDGRSSIVADLGDWVYKRFRNPGRRINLPWAVRPTAAWRSWVFGHGLSDRGLPTPRPGVLLRSRRGPEEYLLTRKVHDARELHAWLAEQVGQPAGDRRRALAAAAVAVGSAVRELHRRNLSHRDLKAANLLLTPPASPEGPPGVWFVDLAGVARHGRLGERRRVRDLARLNASFVGVPDVNRGLRLKFLAAYLQWNLRGRGDWKRLWREVATATGAKVRRNLRRNRPLS